MTKFTDIRFIRKDILKFEVEKDECYGGKKSYTLDTQGKRGKELYTHIERYLGKSFAEAFSNLE